MNEEQINYYYDRILGYSEMYNNSKYIKDNSEKIKERLSKIIDTNNMHILTNSILCYISREEYTVYELESFYSDKLWFHICYLTLYYEKIIYCYRSESFSIRFLKLLDDDTKEVIKEASKYLDKIRKMSSCRVEFATFIYITLSYCHINNNMKDFSRLYSYIFNNKEMLIDDIELNGICDRDDLTNRIINFIENIDNKKLIK